MRNLGVQTSVTRRIALAVPALAFLVGVAAILPALRSPYAAPPVAQDQPAAARLALWRSLLSRPGRGQQAAGSDAARIRLGGILFRDTRLSGPGDRSCATCHQPERAFTDGLPLAAGRSGPLARNTPTLWNIGEAKRLNWDGGEHDLRRQMHRPIESPDEMAGTLDAATRRLAADAGIRASFAKAFDSDGHGDAVTADRIIEALVAYERSLVSPPTRFDRWIAGESGALDAEERLGFDLFVGRGRCATCHAGWRFTDDRLHDIGRPMSARSGWLTEVRTPTLRELVHTAPYMHDGALATLEDVVRHYSSGVVRRGSLSPNIAPVFALDEREIRALAAFLRTLSRERQ